MNHFDHAAHTWDTPDRRQMAGAIHAAMAARVPFAPTWQVLDVGAGTGLLSFALAPSVARVVAADASEGMRRILLEKKQALGVANVESLAFDLERGPGPEGPFDAVVSSMALHHMEDTARALAVTRDLLRPGGWLALADLDAEDGRFHPDNAAAGVRHLGFERGALEALARQVGFTDLGFETAHTIQREGRSYTIFLLVARRA